MLLGPRAYDPELGRFLQRDPIGDPLLVDSALEMESVLGRYWMARGVAIALGPAGSFLRGAALATLLQSGAALCGVALRWRVLLSLALHLDVVFWLESACVTLLLALCRPTELEELASLKLRAGLDLVWRPRSDRLAALLEAANLFTVWWAALLALALAAWMHGRRRMAVSAAASLWLSLVLLRMVTTSR